MPIRSLVMLRQTISAHRRARRGTGRVLPARTRPVRLQATRATSIRPRCPPGVNIGKLTYGPPGYLT
ncbi:hypothetical protein CABS01_15082 [Colletotrichum abscissum]|uniref:uncharacterized protein n=1 Tax=Colletotrichum abscissum TaxID=1671311 RepID=UPI0027D74592|nr:uncharacterized protein CABS01_15082 [Colletotrichum abscissum]KAK1477041.1 hypothetical protein CABS01_15082 [Colletotrichum abscissum]